jgi:cell wall hydrolase
MIDVVLFCLAFNVYFEARGEPLQGQWAVAEVTMLRASLSGRSPCEEVFTDRQFSWTLMERPTITHRVAWDTALYVAKGTLEHGSSFAKGATHFFNPREANPKWAKEMCKVATIGKHVFYRSCQ